MTRFVYFTHSLRSCWNHGNAHFLRGVLSELAGRGHAVQAYEPEQSWSAQNLVADAGEMALHGWRTVYPTLSATAYPPDADPAALIEGADVVIVHEWNEPSLVAALGRLRRLGGRFTLLFHDTHHRAVSEPEAMLRYDLSGYDGVLAFGEALAAVYRGWGWGDRVFTWHEAADTRVFEPPRLPPDRPGAVWIGNWGDGERAGEIEAFLLRPTQAAGVPLDVYGVRYPADARAMLDRYGVRYRGWLPNHRAPEVFARHFLTIHVPRRFYATTLPGIPTIRVFEALACGIPLISAPWEDVEQLFRPGIDYLVAPDGRAMQRLIGDVVHDPGLRHALATQGLATIRARHTCAHRVDELMGILSHLNAGLVTA
jgi:spore maturation protein CgeB